MPASEIDDIFAGKVAKSSSSAAKGKAKAIDESFLPPSTSVTNDKKKKSKKRKRREADNHNESPAESSSRLNGKDGRGDGRDPDRGDGEDGASDKKKRDRSKRPRVVETVQDPSATLPSTSSSSNQKKLPKSMKGRSKSTKEGQKDGDDLDRFKDSRGTGPRKRTEEGFLVYKEDELGIRDGGGDTPLCPFDCNCCF